MTPRRPIQAELDERLAATTELLATGKSDSEVKRTVAERFGLSPRSVERYLRRAREGMVKSTGKDIEALRKESIAIYQAIIDNPDAENRDRIKARERIDKVLGLETHPPFAAKVEVSGPGCAPIQHQTTVVTVDLNAKLTEFAGAVRAAALANVRDAIGIVRPALTGPHSPDAA